VNPEGFAAGPLADGARFVTWKVDKSGLLEPWLRDDEASKAYGIDRPPRYGQTETNDLDRKGEA
jgi:hypothetical protein